MDALPCLNARRKRESFSSRFERNSGSRWDRRLFAEIDEISAAIGYFGIVKDEHGGSPTTRGGSIAISRSINGMLRTMTSKIPTGSRGA